MEGYINLKTLTFDELVGVVNLYPWFSNARKELCVRLLSMGDMDVASEALSDASMYVSSRRALASLLRQQDKADCSDKDIDTVLRAYITEAGNPEKSDDAKEKLMQTLSKRFPRAFVKIILHKRIPGLFFFLGQVFL